MAHATPIGKGRGQGPGIRGLTSRPTGPQTPVFPVPLVLSLISRDRVKERGFTMVAVIVIMAIMAIFLTVAVETVSFQQRREKEEELIFRGNQIVEAIRLFRARNGRFPLALDELVKAKPRVLRKVWADPITGKPDWEPVFFGEEGTNVGAGGKGTAPPQPTPGPTPAAGAKTGPIIGVHSRSCADSIKVFEGRTRYCEWKFYFDPNRKTGVALPGPSPPQLH
jgi:type II secretory pathway pseudopilin PulG